MTGYSQETTSGGYSSWGTGQSDARKWPQQQDRLTSVSPCNVAWHVHEQAVATCMLACCPMAVTLG